MRSSYSFIIVEFNDGVPVFHIYGFDLLDVWKLTAVLVQLDFTFLGVLWFLSPVFVKAFLYLPWNSSCLRVTRWWISLSHSFGKSCTLLTQTQPILFHLFPFRAFHVEMKIISVFELLCPLRLEHISFLEAVSSKKFLTIWPEILNLSEIFGCKWEPKISVLASVVPYLQPKITRVCTHNMDTLHSNGTLIEDVPCNLLKYEQSRKKELATHRIAKL